MTSFRCTTFWKVFAASELCFNRRCLGHSINSRNEFIFLISYNLTKWFCKYFTLSMYDRLYTKWFIYCKYYFKISRYLCKTFDHLKNICCTYGIQLVTGIIPLLQKCASKWVYLSSVIIISRVDYLKKL